MNKDQSVNRILFCNCDIISMNYDMDMKWKNGILESPNAILVENGKIVQVGKVDDFEINRENIRCIDLKGKTIMPSFIDSHSHITALAQTLGIVSLKDVANFEEIKIRLERYIDGKNIKPNEWIVGHGYDHNYLKEKTHPTKYELDKISTKYPIMIVHASGHMGVANSLGLKLLNIDENTKNSEGGIIGRIANTNEPDGYLEENAFIQNSQKVLNLSDEEKLNLLEMAQEEYIKNGITTVQDGITKNKEFEMLKLASTKGRLKIDVVSYVDMKESSNILKENSEYLKKYKNRYKIGGYKIFLDGSPQGKTAWMSKPYENEKEYKGYGIYSDIDVEKFVSKSLEENIQLLAHCNGDQASEQLIRAFEKQSKNQEIKTRPVMIHAQTVRYDQLERMKKLNMIPSFFITHIYYWGDIHIKNLGERAYKISPANYAKKQNLKFTFHQDTPVLNPNMLELVHIAVNRKTKNGIILGKEEIIDVYSALEAITINSAYQYFEKDMKGSIESGKLADLVILSDNPLKVDKDKIKTIKILATLKEGKMVYGEF